MIGWDAMRELVYYNYDVHFDEIKIMGRSNAINYKNDA